MPNTSCIPPNPAPTVNNTRADDKPEPISIREGISTYIRKKILKTKRNTAETYVEPSKIALAKEKARLREEQDDNAPLRAPKAKARAKLKAKLTSVEKERARQAKARARLAEEVADNAPLLAARATATPRKAKADPYDDKPIGQLLTDDNKPLAQLSREAAPKAKAKAKAKAKSKVKTDKISKSALQKEQARQRAKKADEQPLQALVEEAIPKPKAKAKARAATASKGEGISNAQKCIQGLEKGGRRKRWEIS